MQINHELAIMSAVTDSMLGDSEPILGAGLISARGRLMWRLDCHGAQEVARHMCDEGLLYLNNGALTLDIVSARQRMKELLFITESRHPSALGTLESMRDNIYHLMDKMTAALTGYPTVTTYAVATS